MSDFSISVAKQPSTGIGNTLTCIASVMQMLLAACYLRT